MHRMLQMYRRYAMRRLAPLYSLGSIYLKVSSFSCVMCLHSVISTGIDMQITAINRWNFLQLLVVT